MITMVVFLLSTVFLFLSSDFVTGKEDQIIDVKTLLEEIESFQLINFQSEYIRELQGFVENSILIPNEINLEDYIEK